MPAGIIWDVRRPRNTGADRVSMRTDASPRISVRLPACDMRLRFGFRASQFTESSMLVQSLPLPISERTEENFTRYCQSWPTIPTFRRFLVHNLPAYRKNHTCLGRRLVMNKAYREISQSGSFIIRYRVRRPSADFSFFCQFCFFQDLL